jgi:hypothetical protein
MIFLGVGHEQAVKECAMPSSPMKLVLATIFYFVGLFPRGNHYGSDAPLKPANAQMSETPRASTNSGGTSAHSVSFVIARQLVADAFLTSACQPLGTASLSPSLTKTS